MVQVTQQILDNLNLHLSAEPPEQPSQTQFEQHRALMGYNNPPPQNYATGYNQRTVTPPNVIQEGRFNAGPMGRRSDYYEDKMKDENNEEDYIEEEYEEDMPSDEGYADEYDEQYEDGQENVEYEEDMRQPPLPPQSFAGRRAQPPVEEYEDEPYDDGQYEDDQYDDEQYEDDQYEDDGQYENENRYGGNYKGQSYVTETYSAPQTKLGYREQILNDDDMVNYENSDELDMFNFEDRKIPSYYGEPIGDYSMKSLLGEFSEPSKPMEMKYDMKNGHEMGGNVGQNLSEVLGTSMMMDVNAQRMMAKKTNPPQQARTRGRMNRQPQEIPQEMPQQMPQQNYAQEQFGGIGHVQTNEHGDFETGLNGDYFGLGQRGEPLPSQDIFGFGGLNGLNSRDEINQVALSSAVSLEESLGLGKMNMGNSDDIIGFGSFGRDGQRQGLFESGANIDFGLGLGGRMDGPVTINSSKSEEMPVFSIENALFGDNFGFNAEPEKMMAKKVSPKDPQEMDGNKVIDWIKSKFHKKSTTTPTPTSGSGSGSGTSTSTSLVPAPPVTFGPASFTMATSPTVAPFTIKGPDKVGIGKRAQYTTNDPNIVSWTSSDSAIGLMDNSGLLIGVAKGYVTITATNDEGTSQSKIVEVGMTKGQTIGNNLAKTAAYMLPDTKQAKPFKVGYGNVKESDMFTVDNFSVSNDSKGLIGNFVETDYDPLHFTNQEMLNTMTNANDVAGEFSPKGGTNWSDTFGNFGSDTVRTTDASGRKVEGPMDSFSGVIGNFGQNNAVENTNMNGNNNSKSPTEEMFGSFGGNGWAYDNPLSNGNSGNGFEDMFGFGMITGGAVKAFQQQQPTQEQQVNNGNTKVDVSQLEPEKKLTQAEKFRLSNQKLASRSEEDDDLGVGNRASLPRKTSDSTMNTATRRILPSSAPKQQMSGYYARPPRRSGDINMQQQYEYEQPRTDPRNFLSRMVDRNSDYTGQFNRGYEFDSDPSALGAFGLGNLSGAIFGRSAGVTSEGFGEPEESNIGFDMDNMVGLSDTQNMVSDMRNAVGFNDDREMVTDMDNMIGFMSAPQQPQQFNRTLPSSRRQYVRVRAPVRKARNVSTKVIKSSDGSTTTITTTTVGNSKVKKTVKTVPKKKATKKSSAVKKITSSKIAKKSSENMFSTGFTTQKPKKSTKTSKTTKSNKKQSVKSSNSDIGKLIWG